MKTRARSVSPEAQAQERRRAAWLEVLLLAGLLMLFFAARWPFRDADLIRDEGEYVHLGQEILRGRVPYLDIYNQKTPVVFYLMAGVQSVAGTSVTAVHMFTTLYGMGTLLVLYGLVRRLFGWSAAFWAVLSLSSLVVGLLPDYHQANTEYFMLLWMAAGLYLWYVGRETSRLWLVVLAGVSAGLAYQTKQTGVVLMAFFAGERLLGWVRGLKEQRDTLRAAVRDVALAGAGFGLVTAAVVGYFAWCGALDAYIECTWRNNWQYVGTRGGLAAAPLNYLRDVVTTVVRWDCGAWLLGMAALAVLGARVRGRAVRDLWLLLALTLGAALWSGAVFRHYYVPVLLPLAIGSGIGAGWLWEGVASSSAKVGWRVGAAALLVAAWAWPGAHYGQYLTMPPERLEAMKHNWPPFCAAEEVGRYLAQRTAPGEPIMVIGSEPEIYYFAERPAASRMAIMYPMTGPYSYAERLRREFLAQWESALPNYVVLVRLPSSLSERPQQAQQFVDVVSPLLKRYYVPDTVLPRPVLGGGGKGQAEYCMVFRRKDSAQ